METRDHGFKYAFDNDPRGILRLTGRLALSEDARVEVLGTALVAPGKLADSLVLVKTKARAWLDQTEALSWWRSRERLAITRRALTGVLIPKYYRCDIQTSILLMLEEGIPKSLPEALHYDRGGAYGGIRPNWVKLWELDAGEVLALDRRHLLHLVPLMKHSKTQVREAARRIRELGDEGQIALFLLLGERRYHKDELRRWIGVFHDAVVEIGKTTSFGQELMDVGRKEGLRAGEEKGLRAGEEKGLLKAIRSYLAAAFPSLASDPAINRISTVDRASDTLQRLYRARSEDEARAILREAGAAARRKTR